MASVCLVFVFILRGFHGTLQVLVNESFQCKLHHCWLHFRAQKTSMKIQQSCEVVSGCMSRFAGALLCLHGTGSTASTFPRSNPLAGELVSISGGNRCPSWKMTWVQFVVGSACLCAKLVCQTQDLSTSIYSIQSIKYWEVVTKPRKLHRAGKTLKGCAVN